jgi:hypothetical protein
MEGIPAYQLIGGIELHSDGVATDGLDRPREPSLGDVGHPHPRPCRKGSFECAPSHTIRRRRHGFFLRPPGRVRHRMGVSQTPLWQVQRTKTVVFTPLQPTGEDMLPSPRLHPLMHMHSLQKKKIPRSTFQSGQ